MIVKEDGKKMSFKKKLRNIVLLSGLTLAYAFGLGYNVRHDVFNHTNVRFRRAALHPNIGETAAYDIGRYVGEMSLKVSKGEAFQINYALGDEDGLQKIVLKENSKDIRKVSLEDQYNICRGTLARKLSKPGKYIYRLVVTDMKGNKREDIAEVLVKDELFDGGAQVLFDMGPFYR